MRPAQFVQGDFRSARAIRVTIVGEDRDPATLQVPEEVGQRGARRPSIVTAATFKIYHDLSEKKKPLIPGLGDANALV